MERHFVISCDTGLSTVFVREVTRTFSKTADYHHDPSGPIIICGFPDPKFYGQLDALLVTRQKVEKANPIVPEPPPEPSVKQMLADMEHAGLTDAAVEGEA